MDLGPAHSTLGCDGGGCKWCQPPGISAQFPAGALHLCRIRCSSPLPMLFHYQELRAGRAGILLWNNSLSGACLAGNHLPGPDQKWPLLGSKRTKPWSCCFVSTEVWVMGGYLSARKSVQTVLWTSQGFSAIFLEFWGGCMMGRVTSASQPYLTPPCVVGYGTPYPRINHPEGA